MKTFYVILILLGTIANGEVKIYNQYVMKNYVGSETLTFSSREKCENDILEVARGSQKYYGKNQRLYYEPMSKFTSEPTDESMLVLRRDEFGITSTTEGDFEEFRCVDLIIKL